MPAYGDQELERMLADLESDLVERKETFAGDAREKAREAICAFANDLPRHGRPGVLIIGAKEDGSPSGVAVTDQLLQMLSDTKTDGQMVP